MPLRELLQSPIFCSGSMEDKTICWVFEGTVYRLSLGVMVINLYLKKQKQQNTYLYSHHLAEGYLQSQL